MIDWIKRGMFGRDLSKVRTWHPQQRKPNARCSSEQVLRYAGPVY